MIETFFCLCNFFQQAQAFTCIIGLFWAFFDTFGENKNTFFSPTGNDLQNHGTRKDIMSPSLDTMEAFLRTITGEYTITLFSLENCFVKSKNWPVCA